MPARWRRRFSRGRGWCCLNAGNIGNRRCWRFVRRGSWRSPWATVSRGFLFRAETLTAALLAVDHRNLHDLAVDTAPTQLSAMPERFFARAVTLPAAFTALRS